MGGPFEGDLIRPLGHMTMNFGHAEYELDSLLERLSTAGLIPDAWNQRPIGQKLSLLTETIHTLDATLEPALDALLDEIRQLLAQRNTLIHGCILAGGRVVSAQSGAATHKTSPEQLTCLAEQAFAWKERMWSFRWKQVEPLLAFGDP